MSKGKLYLIPSPLGENNPEEVIPMPVLESLAGFKTFVVEEIRTARRYLSKAGLKGRIGDLEFHELNEHTDHASIPSMLEPMAQGHSMGIISEAGCPAIADPGADVVAIAQQRGYNIEPLVGPSSILLSLMASGFNGQLFAFNGYLPIDQNARNAKLKEMERRIRRERQTQIFIETPYRNNKLIEELSRTLPGDVLLCVASDITGQKQSIITRRLSQWSKASYDYNKIPTIFLLFS